MYHSEPHNGNNASTPSSTTPPAYTPSATSYKTLLFYSVAALAVAIIVRFFIAAPYIVSGASMEPTFDSWNYLIVDRISYSFNEPQRGDVVVFQFPQDPSRSFIKRIIGLPNETVILSGTQVLIQNDDQPEGITLDETYVAEKNFRPSHMTITLGKNEYFVLGDNRLQSADSRVWGALSREFLVGRPFIRLFPFTEIDFFPGSTVIE